MAAKRGGKFTPQPIVDKLTVLPLNPRMLLDLNDAIGQLQETDAEAYEWINLLLFAGVFVAEAGRLLRMTRHVPYRHWVSPHLNTSPCTPVLRSRLRKGCWLPALVGNTESRRARRAYRFSVSSAPPCFQICRPYDQRQR